MEIAQIGELGLIRRLEDALRGQALEPGVLGIGDDAAAFPALRSLMLATTDSLVEGYDFRLGQISWADLGWKALAVNLSDIAAMGGEPRYALVALAMPATVQVADIDALYQGMLQAARSYGVAILGGDLSGAPQVSITITLLGCQPEGWSGSDALLRRNRARPGQQVAVTGSLGTSAAGQRMLSRSERFDAETEATLRAAHFRPRPRVAEGRALLRAGIRCAIDISDGLLRDLGHICFASGVDAVVQADQLPVAAAVRRAYPQGWLSLALAGGEDFELLCTGAQAAVERATQQMETPLTVVGRIVGPGTGRVTVLDAEGRELHFERTGWDHFLS
jgi:thiamine-monophosphate kinase